MRILPSAILCAILLSGCSAAQDVADSAQRAGDVASKAQDCAALAGQVRRLLPERTPTRAEAEKAATELQDKAAQIDSADVRRAGDTLTARAKEYAAAVARGDTTQIERARKRVETAAREAATTCGVPVESFQG
jgi:hypothetical protein